MTFRAIRTARTPQGAVVWAMSLIALPYVALPIFLFLGHTRLSGYAAMRRASKLAHAPMPALDEWRVACRASHGSPVAGFQAMGKMPLVSGNAARLLVDGEATFADMLAAIDAAERYVLVQFYILRADGIGQELKARLIGKARAGCDVRLLYDAIGSYGLSAAYLAELRAAGVSCVDFHSIRKPHSRFQINFRNHRKVVIVDGQTGFVGGFNVGDEYNGSDPQYGHWRDTHLRLDGPAVAQLQLLFAEDWKWATEEQLALEWHPTPQPEDLPAMIVAPSPADALETGSLYFCNAINAAQRRVWIASPYFVPDVDIQSALALAALRGVEVRILVTGRRDHLLVWLAAFAYFDEMRRAGVEIWRYRDGFMHQKVILVDDAFASVGTLNLDNRSCRLNFEATALIFDAGFARKVEAMLEQDFGRSDLYVTPLDEAPSLLVRYGAPVARLLAPLL